MRWPSFLGYPMASFKSDTNIARFGADLRSTLRPLNLSTAIKDKEFNPILVETSGSVKVVNEVCRVLLLFQKHRRANVCTFRSDVQVNVGQFFDIPAASVTQFCCKLLHT